MRVRSVSVGCAALAALAAAACMESPSPTQPGPITVPVQFSTAQHAGEAHNHRAHLSGREEVPANDSRAQGQAVFQVGGDGTSLDFRLIVANIQNVTQAHIHCGVPGANGPIVAWLYPSGPPAQLIPGRSQGVLAQGTIRAADVRTAADSAACPGGLAAGDFAGLLARIRAGGAYVNVHTSQFPPGEVRGQID